MNKSSHRITEKSANKSGDYFSPAARAVLRYWRAGNICPSDEPGLADCVTDDALFFEFLIADLEEHQVRDAPQWCMQSPTVNRN